MFGAQPTAGAVHDVAQAVPLAQAKLFGQAAVAGVPHAPLVQVLAWVSVALVHDAAGHVAHAPPVAPHAPLVLPPTQEPLLQHPPLQDTDVEQEVSHVFVDELQFTLAGQSVAALWQPHIPPLPVVAVTHASAARAEARAAQVQTPPLEPQAVGERPVVHVPPVVAEQHPPLQS